MLLRDFARWPRCRFSCVDEFPADAEFGARQAVNAFQHLEERQRQRFEIDITLGTEHRPEAFATLLGRVESDVFDQMAPRLARETSGVSGSNEIRAQSWQLLPGNEFVQV